MLADPAHHAGGSDHAITGGLLLPETFEESTRKAEVPLGELARCVERERLVAGGRVAGDALE